MKTHLSFSLLLMILVCGVHTAFAEGSPAGEWIGWGSVTVQKENDIYHGTYTDTYGTGPGTMQFKKISLEDYEGTWGESVRRHGTLKIRLNPDGKHLTGTWKADKDCTIGKPGEMGRINWTRKEQ